MRRTARRSTVAMSWPSCRQKGSSSSWGTTWLTRPHDSAVAASRKLPVVESSLARRNPTASGSSTVRPQPGHDPDPGVGVGEAGPLRRDEEVAGEGQLEAAGDGDAVDGADDRRLHVGERALAGAAPGRWPRSSPSAHARRPAPSGRRPAQNAGSAPVSTMAARSSRASRSRSVVEIALRSVAVQRVARVGAVERDGGDGAVDLHEHEVVGHVAHPSSSAGRKSSFRSPRRTSVEAIQPPIALKWSSRIEPSARVASSSS